MLCMFKATERSESSNDSVEAGAAGSEDPINERIFCHNTMSSRVECD
jgi:hypothetical protein